MRHEGAPRPTQETPQPSPDEEEFQSEYPEGVEQPVLPFEIPEQPAGPDEAQDETSPDGSEVLDTENPVPETFVDQQDTLNRREDAEILGRSFAVRRTIQNAAREAANNHQLNKAERQNRRAAPKLWWREKQLNRVQSKYERKLARAENTNSNILKKHRLKKAEAYKQNKVDFRQKRYDTHKAAMDSRIENARAGTVERNTRYQEKVDQWKATKQAAVARKELRRELRQEGAGRRERKEIMRGVSAEQMQQFGRAACLQEASRRQAAKSERRTNKAAARVTELQTSIRNTERGALDSAQLARRMSDRIGVLEESEIPALGDKLGQAREHLDTFSPGDMSEEFLEAKRRVHEAQKAFDAAQKEIVDSEKAARDARRRHDSLLKSQETLERQLDRATAQQESQTRRHGNVQAAYDQRRTERRQAFEQAFDNDNNNE